MSLERPARTPPTASADDISAFAKCRNERLRLPAFLRHYRALGVHRFFIVDHDSSDGSAEYLHEQPDVWVFRTHDAFRDSSGGARWLNQLLSEFGVGWWCVTVDIDELLVYPGSERAALPVLTRYLDAHGFDALACLLLDMYPAGSLSECRYAPGDDPIAAAPFFDPGPYRTHTVKECPGVLIRGGMRERVFFPEFRGLRAPLAWLLGRPRPPCLTKVPLVRWDASSSYLYANHWTSPKRVATESGALLHIKFFQDFHERAVREAARGEYFKGAVEYQRYAARLARDPSVALKSEQSVRFTGTRQLVELGLIRDTATWAAERGSLEGQAREAAPVDPVVGDERRL